MEQQIEGTNRNPLDWYSLTETANSILNELIAYTAREEMLELEKEHPDAKRLAELQQLFEEVHEVNDEPENFKNQELMQGIIEKYGVLLKGLNSK